MCGIAGTFAFNSHQPVCKEMLEQMTTSIQHRGPDGAGYYYSRDGSLGFGHRRLSIIDLTTGDQPMCNEDGTIWITFNGEIYNYRELRAQLKARGHRFKTTSDTEVIVHAYEEWNEDCAAKFNGIFAFAIWDERKHRLFLARDHFGVKPLYYYENAGVFHFASEMKAILCDRTVPRAIDLDALHFILAFRHTPSPWTLFKSIRKLPPASRMVVDYSGVKTQQYWSLPAAINHERTEADWIESLAAAYPEAVKRQMVADTPIGLSLSGGVDSNTLLALMSKEQAHVHTFTVGFHGTNERDDELEAAEEASKQFGADFSGRRVSDADYLAFMERYMWHLEEPIGNESAAAYYFVAKLAQGKVKVLLSGQGADEPFAGYGRHLAAQYVPYLQWLPPQFAKPLGSIVLPLFGGQEPPRRFIEALAQQNEIGKFLSMYTITTPAMRREMFNDDFATRSNPYVLTDYIRAQLARAPMGTMLEKMTYIDARTSLTDNLLLCGDKMAMAASIEMRVPFLDLEVMRIAESIPGNLKVAGLNNKMVHKKVCERWLPRSIVHRRKVGFNEAMGNWLKTNLDRTLTELIESPDSIARHVLKVPCVKRLQREHSAGIRDHQRILFLLLSIETWRKVFT